MSSTLVETVSMESSRWTSETASQRCAELRDSKEASTLRGKRERVFNAKNEIRAGTRSSKTIGSKAARKEERMRIERELMAKAPERR